MNRYLITWNTKRHLNRKIIEAANSEMAEKICRTHWELDGATQDGYFLRVQLATAAVIKGTGLEDRV